MWNARLTVAVASGFVYDGESAWPGYSDAMRFLYWCEVRGEIRVSWSLVRVPRG